MFSKASKKDVDAVKFWAASRLNELSLVHQSMEDVNALIHMKSDDELVLALMEVIGQSDDAMEFIESLMKKRSQLMDGSSISLTHSQDGMVAYQKTALGSKKNDKSEKQQKQKDQQQLQQQQQQQQQQQKQAKKKKDVVTREECYCMGTDHPCLGNCLSCGKIICELEGAGQPCTFCGVVFNVGSSSNNNKAAFAEAVARKNALLEYERKSIARSLIYDDQGDYFNSDSQWMSQEEKTRLRNKEKELREQKQKQKKGVKITLDIFGRRMIMTEDEDANKSIYQPFNLADILPTTAAPSIQQEKGKLTISGTTTLRPSYQKSEESSVVALPPVASSSKAKKGTRIQHAYFEVEDDGVGAGSTASETNAAYFQFSGVCFDECPPLPLKELEESSIVVELERYEKMMTNAIVRARYPLTQEALKKFFDVIRTDAVKAVVMDFSACSEVTTSDSRFNTLAKFHASLVAEAVGCKSDKGAVEIWLLPLHHALDGDYVVARKYWNELNETVRKNVAFVLTSSLQHNPIISKEHIKAARAAFADKRALILFDEPSTDFVPYSGRHFGLELKGLFVTTRGQHPKADSLAILSALAFQRRPASYDATETFKHVVALALGEQVTRDCKEARCLLEVSQFVPRLARDKAEIEIMRRQLVSRRRLDEIQESCRLLMNSQVIKQWLQGEFSVLEESVLKPVQELCQACRSTAVQLTTTPARTGVVQKKKKKNKN